VFSLKAYAKVNLYLFVRSKRKDGFHSLHTLFERISLADTVSFSSRKDGRIVLTCTDSRLPVDQGNLVVRSATLLKERFKVKQGATLRLSKRVPLGSGMGGGSSDAAATLMGLNRLWKLGLSRHELCLLGARIGSDVPFFLYNCSFAWGTGRGEKIAPVALKRRICLWHIIIVPRINVSTPLIYREGDKQGAFRLTKPGFDATIMCLAVKKHDLAGIEQCLFNSLEPVTRNLYPEVGRIREKLCGLGLKLILMSGSGPAVFGLTRSKKEAVAVRKQLMLEEKAWCVFVARTV
jgi:4-diphosphocytidyl-2-C-methyl-D-erythritol kinase